MPIKRFGESLPKKEPKIYWYELATGERVYCDEETIAKLWCDWVVRPDVERADTEEFTVFEYSNPREIDLKTAVNWS